MKYQELLDTNMVPEWRNQYLDYRGLDAALNRAIESKNIKARQRGVDLYSGLIKFNQKFASYFGRECQSQLEKINAFHREKLLEMKGKFNNLHDQLEQVLASAIYREIQPKLGDYGASQGRTQGAPRDSPSGSADATVGSVSELFKSLKARLGTTSSSPNGSPTNSSHPRPGAAQHPSVRNLFPGSSSPSGPRRSLTPLFQETAAALRRDSSQHLRAGREKMTVMARKLSDSFAHSAHRVTHNLRNIHPVGHNFNYATHLQQQHHHRPNLHHRDSDLTANGRFNSSDHKQPRARTRRVAIVYDRPPEINIAATARGAQSRQNIVASYKKKLAHLKFAFGELYFNLVLFEQYTQLNYTGFQQILRKHDRMFASSLGRKFYEEHVQTADFYTDLHEIDQLIENVEHIYTLHFENGNRRKAIEKLQVPTNVYKTSSAKLDFRVGYEFGIFTVLLALVILTGVLSETGYDWRTVFRLYRSPMVLIIFMFQTGISIVIWKHYKINHVLIFELNPRNNLSFHHFIEFGSLLGIIWSISVLLFLFSSKFNLKPSVCPLVVVLIIVVYMFNPTQTCHHQARFWLLKILGRIFMAPFASGGVRFADFWIADQLVSIVPLFLDLEFLFCFYTTGEVLSVDHLTPYYANRCVTRNPQDLVIRTIVAALPAWFRCAQCLRRWRDENWLRLHLANAGKYWCMVMVVMFSSIAQYNKSSFELETTRIIWMVAALFTSSLTAYWDIIYDFGLFNKYDKSEEEDEKESGPKTSATALDSDDELDLETNNYTTPNGRCQEDEAVNGLRHFLRRKQMRSNGAGRRKKRSYYPFLRKELVYPVWVYYFAIVENIILRFGWIITISLTEFSGIEAGLVVSLLAPMEMFRRFVWNCIRLENEQLNNCGLFRAVRDIPMEVVAPIDESHLDKVIMMMDSRDGPSMRNLLMKRRTMRPDRVSFVIVQKPGAENGGGSGGVGMTRRCDPRA